MRTSSPGLSEASLRSSGPSRSAAAGSELFLLLSGVSRVNGSKAQASSQIEWRALSIAALAAAK